MQAVSHPNRYVRPVPQAHSQWSKTPRTHERYMSIPRGSESALLLSPFFTESDQPADPRCRYLDGVLALRRLVQRCEKRRRAAALTDRPPACRRPRLSIKLVVFSALGRYPPFMCRFDLDAAPRRPRRPCTGAAGRTEEIDHGSALRYAGAAWRRAGDQTNWAWQTTRSTCHFLVLVWGSWMDAPARSQE